MEKVDIFWFNKKKVKTPNTHHSTRIKKENFSDVIKALSDLSNDIVGVFNDGNLSIEISHIIDGDADTSFYNFKFMNKSILCVMIDNMNFEKSHVTNNVNIDALSDLECSLLYTRCMKLIDKVNVRFNLRMEKKKYQTDSKWVSALKTFLKPVLDYSDENTK